MATRGAAVEVTRERILNAACDAFLTSRYDDVTLRDVAAAADVALQTVVNHFGTKEALYGAAVERIGDAIEARRYDVEPGDVEGAVAALIADYDRTGDFTLADARRRGATRGRRAGPRTRAARPPRLGRHIFPRALTGLRGAARQRRLAQLVAVTDVYTWKLLRRDKGLSRDQTVLAVRELAEALHNPPEGGS